MQNTTCYIHESNFTSNSANRSGGVLYMGGVDLTVRNNRFANNEAPTGPGGVLYSNNSNAKIENSTFHRNIAGSGSTFYLSASKVTAHSSLFYYKKSNMISLSSNSQIFLNNSSLLGQDLENSPASQDASKGDLLMIDDKSALTIHNGNISLVTSDTIIKARADSSIVMNGTYLSENHIGSIITAQLVMDITIDNCMVIKNVASGNGGLVQSTGTSVTISNSTLQKNVVYGMGGTIYCKYGNVFIYNSDFLGNRVMLSAGIVYLLGDGKSKLQVVKSHFYRNTAKVDGAVLYTTDSVDIALDSCNFTDNKAQSDSALMLFDAPSLRTSNCLFSSSRNTSNLVSIYFERYLKHINDTNYMTFQTVFKFRNKTLISNKTNNFVKEAEFFGAIKVHDSLRKGYQIKHAETMYASGK